MLHREASRRRSQTATQRRDEGAAEPQESGPVGGHRAASLRTILESELDEAIADGERILALEYWPGGERRQWWQTWLELREGLVAELGGDFAAVRSAFEAARRVEDGAGAEHRDFIDTDRPFLEGARGTMTAGKAAAS